ncbi:unnamed protein product [Ambrosiozyma monospora]|uniref:Unnamed protein product n=1 Tax=Ambrosiozyma monospora TaxID=43982 RepID=A0A9W7DDC6_AMBMO|nr:unnamed protein product [Ambrosiozyma monospora]
MKFTSSAALWSLLIITEALASPYFIFSPPDSLSQSQSQSSKSKSSSTFAKISHDSSEKSHTSSKSSSSSSKLSSKSKGYMKFPEHKRDRPPNLRVINPSSTHPIATKQ